jgi:hypothetical protein
LDGRVYHAQRIRVREFVEIMAAGSDLARAQGQPRETCEAWEKIQGALEAVSSPKPDLGSVPLSSVTILIRELWEWSMGPAEPKEGDREIKGDVRRFSREELLVPVYKTAMLLGRDPEEILDTEMTEFNRLKRICGAAWADLRLDLAEVAMMPHLTGSSMKRAMRRLEKERDLAPEDSSPWHQHVKEYEARLKG